MHLNGLNSLRQIALKYQFLDTATNHKVLNLQIIIYRVFNVQPKGTASIILANANRAWCFQSKRYYCLQLSLKFACWLEPCSLKTEKSKIVWDA